MAMMLMVKSVKNAGTTDYNPEIGWSDVLHKEVIGEQKQALLVCKSVLAQRGGLGNILRMNSIRCQPVVGIQQARK